MLVSYEAVQISPISPLCYIQALNDAKRELRYLLVYLHGDDHQDTDEFCRYVVVVCSLEFKYVEISFVKCQYGHI